MIEVRDMAPATLPAAWTTLARHPDFAAAARRLATNMLFLCEDDKQLAAIFKDAGRYVAAMSAAYLHGTGGLTLPLLRQICSRTGFLSPGRASAIIGFLLHIDYLRPAPDMVAGHYIPTERFLLAWRRHLQAALDAAAVIEPALGALSSRLVEPDMFMAFLAIQAARLHTITQEANHFPALTRAFLHPDAGSQILWVMMLSGEGTLPATDEIRLSLAHLSRRFDVTHLHVRRLLRQAQCEGMLIYHGRGRFSFEPGGLDELRHHYAFQLSELIESGKEMLAR
jgi:hypothetical protein